MEVFGHLLHLVRKSRFFQPVRKQAFQRKQRQEHIEVDVSEHRSVRNSRMLSKVARPEQALLFAANGHKHHTPPELAEDGMKFFNVFCEVLTDFEVKLFLSTSFQPGSR